jgi:alkenylglycerophosphocholine hydrolase
MPESRQFLPFIVLLAAFAYFLQWDFDSKTISVALKMTPALLMGLYVVLRRPGTCAAMAFALVMHAIGDGCLDLGKAYFLAGVAAFFMGHFGYIASFWPYLRHWKDVLILTKLLIGGVVIAMLGLNLFIWPKMPGVLAVAAPVYAVALTTMCVTALLGKWNGPWVAIGALLFLFSDVLIGLRLFLDEKTLAFMIWPTYVAAQILIPVGWVQAPVAEKAAT